MLQYSGQQPGRDAKCINERALLSHMQRSMRLNIEARCYTNAIFFADKIFNLLRSRELHLSQSNSQNQNFGTAAGAVGNQAAAPPGGRGDADSSN